MPWHELKALHRENIDAENNKRSKKHRRKLLGKLSTDLDYLEGTAKEFIKPLCDSPHLSALDF